MSSLPDIIPNLRALLALLVARAQDSALSASRLLRLVRTIERLGRAIIMAEVMVYQAKVKAAMLADPVWRARVIWELGGSEVIETWRQSFRQSFRQRFQPRFRQRLQQGAQSGRSSGAAPPPQKSGRKGPLSTPERKSQFCLARPPRAYHGRAQADGQGEGMHQAKPKLSPFDVPIPLMPHDLFPPLETKSAAGVSESRKAHNETQEPRSAGAKTQPPLKPEPP